MSASKLLPAAGGLIGWAAAFTWVYALHGIGCASGWEQVDLGPANLQRLVLVLSWAVWVLVLVLSWAVWVLVLALWLWRARRRRVNNAGAAAGPGRLLLRLIELTAWVGLAATVVSLMPVVTHALCI